MADVFHLTAESRSEVGKAAVRRMRRLEDRIPAIVYGGGIEPQKISMSHNELKIALGKEAVYSHILTLNVDGKEEQVVLKALDRHPSKAKVLHADFLRVKMKEAIIMHVPLHFIGEEEAKGVKEGGIISKLMTDLEIKCLPGDLPEYIELDITNLELDHALHLSDIKLPKGVELAHIETLDEEHDKPVISIHTPKVAKEDIEAEAAEAAAAEEASAESVESETPAEDGAEAKAESDEKADEASSDEGESKE